MKLQQICFHWEIKLFLIPIIIRIYPTQMHNPMVDTASSSGKEPLKETNASNFRQTAFFLNQDMKKPKKLTSALAGAKALIE